MTKNQSIVKKTESAIDDFIDLWRRRKGICIIVLIILVAPICFSLYLKFLEIPNLESKISGLVKDLDIATKERDKAEIMLAPFYAAAEHKFPNEQRDKSLELLMDKLDEVATLEQQNKMLAEFKETNQNLTKDLGELKKNLNSYVKHMSEVQSQTLQKIAEKDMTEPQSQTLQKIDKKDYLRLTNGGKFLMVVKFTEGAVYDGKFFDLVDNETPNENRMIFSIIKGNILMFTLYDSEGNEHSIQGSFNLIFDQPCKLECSWSLEYNFIAILYNDNLIAHRIIPEFKLSFSKRSKPIVRGPSFQAPIRIKNFELYAEKSFRQKFL